MTLRITRLKLVNFIGIWEGTGRDELIIDFGYESDNNIVILAGGNGSGKTTILSTLHPLAHNHDERKDIIIPGKEGIKEIEYSKDGIEYKIQHHYGKSIKSYIQKDGVELNPNGGVRTFESVVESELDFDKTYFRIGRIGDNNRNFIDMTATSRKNFIFENFLPNVDDYLESFKVINELHRTLKGNVGFLVEELGKLGDIDELQNDKKNMELKLERIESSYKEASENLVSLETLYKDKRDTILKDINENIDNIDITDKFGNIVKESLLFINDQIELLNQRSNELIQIGKDYTNKFSEGSNTENEKLKLEYGIQEVNKNVEEFNNTISDNKLKLDEINSNLKSIQKQYQEVTEGLGNESLEDIENEISNLKEDSEVLKENAAKQYGLLLSEFNLSEEKALDISNNYKSADLSIYKLRDYISKYSEFSLFIDKLRRDYNMGNDINDYINYKNILFPGKDLNELKEKMELLKESKSKLNFKKKDLENKLEESDILKLRPDDCTIDSCSFISNALKNKNLYETEYPKLIEEEKEILRNMKDLRDLINEIEPLEVDYPIIEEVEKLYNIEVDGDHIFELLAPKLEEVFEFDTEIKFNSMLDTISSYTNNLLNIEGLSSIVEKLENRMDKLKSVSNMTKMLDERKVTLEEEYSKLENNVNITKDEINTNLSKLKELEELLELVNDYTKVEDELESIEKEVERYQNLHSKFNESVEEIVNLNSNRRLAQESVEVRENELNITKERVSEIEMNVVRYNDYKEKKDSLDNKLEKVTLIHDALNPKTGIPVVMIGEYLDETADIANRLLDLSQKGQFRIKFNVNEKEFKIPVSTGDLVEKEDINLASQGQKALAKVSLSFALIQQSLSTYNILALDEMDSTLDDKNSKYYIDMLTEQIQQLGSDQVFIISHNREFDSQPVDLILLKDHGLDIENEAFMQGKNIIFNLYEEEV